jgi:tetratricopeptide (TPR) repeat protein
MTFSNLLRKLEDSSVLCAFIILFANFFVFEKALNNGFVNFDDPAFVIENSMVSEFSVENFKDIFLSLHTANWQPLTWISHSIDRYLFGLDPRGHHFTSIMIHGLNGFLIFLLFELIFKAQAFKGFDIKLVRFIGLFVAIIFSIHPLRIESVVWISERKDLLCAFFVLLTYCSYIKFHLEKTEGENRDWPLSSIVYASLALMAKPMAVTIPMVLLILDIYPLKRSDSLKNFIRLALAKWPFFILSLAIGLITIIGQKKVGALAPIIDFSFHARAINSVHNIFFYIEKTILPANLAPVYPHVDSLSMWDGRFIGTVCFFIGVTLFCWVCWCRGERAWGVAWLYYLIVLAPVVGLIQVGAQAAANRYTYLSTLSLYFLVGGGFFSCRFVFKKKSISFLLIPLVFVTFICLGTSSAKQIEVWKDSETLWRRNIEIYPGKQPETYRLLGEVLRIKKRYREAESMFTQALKINPKFSAALTGLGLVYLEEKRLEKAKFNLVAALKADPKNIEAKNNLGLVFQSLTQRDEAKKIFEEILEVDPNRSETLNNLGKLFFDQKLYEQAEKYFKKASISGSNQIKIRVNLALVYFKTDRFVEAEIELISAIKMDPNFIDAHLLLGAVYIEANALDQSEKTLHLALKIDPENSLVKENLKIIEKRRRLNLR